MPILNRRRGFIEKEYGLSDDAFLVLFVASDSAHGHYEPDFKSAISMTPPFGSTLHIKKQTSDWVFAEFFAKSAWFNCAHLNAIDPAERISVPEPFPGYGCISGGCNQPVFTGLVEVGPRGGRFTRNGSGYRRYL